MKKWQKYLLLFGALILFGIMVYLLINPPINQKNQKQVVVKNIEEQIGAEIEGDGFIVTYDSDLDLLTIKITSEPYAQYKQSAADFLKKEYKIKVCDQNYEFIPAPGIDAPGDNINELASCKK